MNEFKTYHPIVNFIYFVFIIGFSCFLMHPICLALSIICGFIYSVMLKGIQAFKTNILYMLPMLIISALVNPAFNHEGVTILCYLPDGNPLTLESIFYGFAAAIMIASVICWFSCYNEIMTSDKFIYLFGKIIPSLSLIFSMTLRLVPKFLAQAKVVTNAQKCIGRDISNGGLIRRAKNGIRILSILTTWSIENAIETADSMKSRGYGIPGRTAFSIFSFDTRDKKALIYVVLLGSYILFGTMDGCIGFQYFPSASGSPPSAYSVSIFAAYFLLCIYPIVIEILEVKKWNALKSST